MKQYIIECRYECWTSRGKEFTKWFSKGGTPMTEQEAKDKIKEFKTNFEYVDKKTKLKHEYQLKDYQEYLKEKKKEQEEIEKYKKHQEEYYKSSEYKELQKKKRQANKELKERQRIYQETHKKEEADL